MRAGRAERRRRQHGARSASGGVLGVEQLQLDAGRGPAPRQRRQPSTSSGAEHGQAGARAAAEQCRAHLGDTRSPRAPPARAGAPDGAVVRGPRTRLARRAPAARSPASESPRPRRTSANARCSSTGAGQRGDRVVERSMRASALSAAFEPAAILRRSSALSSVSSSTPCSRATSRSVRPLADAVLDDLRRLVVADERVERGGDGERALGGGLAALEVGLDAVDALLGEQPSTSSVSRWIDCSRLRAISGMRTLSSNWPCRPPMVIAVSLPITCAETCRTTSGSTGLTLPGMIEEPFCSSGRNSSPMPARGPEPISARSLAILVSETAIDLQRAGQLDQRVAVALRLERVLGRRDRQPGVAGELRADALGELGVGVEAGAGRGAAERDLRDLRQRVLDAPRGRGGSARRSRRTPGRA